MRAHERNISFTCPICAKNFMIEHEFEIHVANHNGRQINKTRPSCPDCGKDFGGKEALRSHMYIHTGEMHYKCRMCATPFRIYSSMLKHIRKHHPNDSVYYCDLCHFSTDKTKLFDRHNTTAGHRQKHGHSLFLAKGNRGRSPIRAIDSTRVVIRVPAAKD